MTTGYEHGGPFLGSGDPTGTTAEIPRYVEFRRKYPRFEEWRRDPELQANLRNVMDWCVREFGSAGSQADRNELKELCVEYANDVMLAHMAIDVAWEVDPPRWGWLLPTPELMEKWYGTGLGFYQTMLDYQWSRDILKDTLENSFQWGSAVISELALGYNLKHTYPRIHTGYKVLTVGTTNVGVAIAFRDWLDNVRSVSERMFDNMFGDEQGQEPLGVSESYEPPREWEGYEEGNMPYNRRTGQWYPARRYGRGSRFGRYNRYGNRGGWSPRRRRTYRRW